VLVTFRRRHVLAYKAATGRVAIDRVLADGRGTDTRWDSHWSLGWTSFVPIQLGGVPYYLAYKLQTGEVNIDHVNPGGAGTTPVAGTYFTPGWTHFAPLTLGPRYYLAYKTGTGELAIDEMANDGTGVTNVFMGNVGAGWTSVMPFPIGGDQHVLLYNSASGDVAIYHIRPFTGSHPRLPVPDLEHHAAYRSSWTGGWTTFVPFSLAGRQRQLAYKSGDGTVAIGRLCG
jgi:hypothetical protein